MLKVENGQVAWVSVWCRQYSIDFGHAFLTTKDSVRREAVTLILVLSWKSDPIPEIILKKSWEIETGLFEPEFETKIAI